MYRCKNCNTTYQNGGYCSNCGSLLEPVAINSMNDNHNSNEMGANNVNRDAMTSTLNYNINQSKQEVNLNNNVEDKNFSQVVKKDDKKYAIISIILGVGSIILYFFVGLSVWIALVICSIGISLANKSKNSSPGLSKVGIIVNSILGILAVIMWILLIITEV